MARYMLLWEADTNTTPHDPKAKKTQLLGFAELIAKQLKEGVLKEWGMFSGETSGYSIFEGNSVDLVALTAGWVPYAKFKTRELMAVDEVKNAYMKLPEK